MYPQSAEYPAYCTSQAKERDAQLKKEPFPLKSGTDSCPRVMVSALSFPHRGRQRGVALHTKASFPNGEATAGDPDRAELPKTEGRAAFPSPTHQDTHADLNTFATLFFSPEGFTHTPSMHPSRPALLGLAQSSLPGSVVTGTIFCGTKRSDLV